MTTWAALVREVRRDPEADGPRLVAADWLIERDDPRGEYIVLATTPDLSAEATQRLDVLFDTHGVTWSQPLHALGCEAVHGRETLEFERGFIEHAVMRGPASAQFARACALEPIVRLMVTSTVPELAAQPELALVRSLHVNGEDDPILASPHLATLPRIGFGIDFTAKTAARLAASVIRPRHLSCKLDAPVVTELARGDVLTKVVELARYQLDEATLIALGTAALPALRRLELFTPTPPRGLDAIHAQLGQLDTLCYHAPIDAHLATRLAHHLRDGRLREVRINCIGFDLAAIALLESAAFANVHTLAIGDRDVPPALTAALANLAARGALQRVLVPERLELPGVTVERL